MNKVLNQEYRVHDKKWNASASLISTSISFHHYKNISGIYLNKICMPLFLDLMILDNFYLLSTVKDENLAHSLPTPSPSPKLW